MTRVPGCILLLATSVFLAAASSPDWVEQKIQGDHQPISLRTEAIELFSETVFELQGDTIRQRHRQILQIVKTEGLSRGTLIVFSDADSKVSDIKGWRFNRDKVFRETLEKKNISHLGFSQNLVDDARQVQAKFRSVDVGDIVAFEYIHEMPRLFRDRLLPMAEDIDLVDRRVIVPSGVNVAILNDSQQSILRQENGYRVANVAAVTEEADAPPLFDRVPLLALSFNGGDYRSWEDFSRFYWTRTKNRRDLPDQIRESLSDLFARERKEEFIREVLKHVRGSINYVAIELGMGGHIPRDLAFIHQKKYGDCKDMVFYAAAILRAKGIEAFPLLAKMKDDGSILPEFPGNQFNHVILGIALDEETQNLKNLDLAGKPFLIADPTDRFAPLGAIDANLEGCKALPVLDHGGDLLTLPTSAPEKNRRAFDIDIDYDQDGRVTVVMKKRLSGQFAATERWRRAGTSHDDQETSDKKYVHAMVPGSQLQSFNYSQDGDEVIIDYAFSAGSAGIPVNDQVFLIPNIIDQARDGLSAPKRTAAIDFRFPYVEEITITATIDPRFSIVSIPPEAKGSTDFFDYRLQVNRSGEENRVILSKRFTLLRSRIPVDDYGSFREAFRDYLKRVKAPIIVRKR